MNLLTSIWRRKPRPATARKRPKRSLAMSFAALESRALLTMVGPVAMTTASASVAAISVAPPPPADLSLASSGWLNLAPGGGNDAGANNGGWKTGGDPDPSDRLGGGSTAGQPFDPSKNHVAIAEANISVNGVATPEFALADAAKSEIFIRVGNTIEPALGSAQGIDGPESIDLAFLGSNPYPDLIVANSSGDNVLVFPGEAGGQFGPALAGPGGFTVGQNPVNVTVSDVNGDGVPDLLVANQGSNTVSIIKGQVSAGNWGEQTAQTIQVGDPTAQTGPVKVLYADVNNDGLGDLIVLNKAADDLYVYDGTGHGDFNTSDPNIFDVGNEPEDMLMGQFDRHQQLDLVTVNSGSDNLTIIDGILTPRPTIETISSGGITPDAAFAFQPNPNSSGEMDLVVANGGDGHLALLQPGSGGLQLAGVISASNVPIPTSLAAGKTDGSDFEFFAASAGSDAAELLRFDLGISSTYLPTPLSASNEATEAASELVAGLMSSGDSAIELIAVFSVGGPDQSALSAESNLHEPSSITALYSPTEGQGEEDVTPTADLKGSPAEPQESQAEPLRPEPTAVANFVAGTRELLDSIRRPIEAIAARDALPTDDSPTGDRLTIIDRQVFDRGLDSGDDSVSGAGAQSLGLRGWEDQTSFGEASPAVDIPTDLSPEPPTEGIDTPALEGQFQAVPLISSAVLISTRLIIKATPPRPSSFRKKWRFRIFGENPSGGPSA